MPIEANFSSVRGLSVSYKVYATGCFAVHGCLLWADVTDIKKKWQARMSSPFLLKLFFMESVTSDHRHRHHLSSRDRSNPDPEPS